MSTTKLDSFEGIRTHGRPFKTVHNDVTIVPKTSIDKSNHEKLFSTYLVLHDGAKHRPIS
jgi:hypothetical protein